ncbi:MAG: hypothetical protein C5B49_16570 [Bdellovibrio sp.]|nr:MAG: hypothetical protein C5B49_16570 [Bdellovibrio sp.]
MDLAFLSQADSATVKLELAKTALETAKNNLETAKQAYEELLAQADAHGIPKAKLKKLMEDRVQPLFESGILGTLAFDENHRPAGEVKRERSRKIAKKPEGDLATGELGGAAHAGEGFHEEGLAGEPAIIESPSDMMTT